MTLPITKLSLSLAVLMATIGCRDATSQLASDGGIKSINCLGAPQVVTVDVYTQDCVQPATLKLDSTEYKTDFDDLEDRLWDLVIAEQRKLKLPVPIEGEPFTSASKLIPKVSNFLNSSGKKYEMWAQCIKLDNGNLGCSSGSADWTDRGWSYFIRDFLNDLKQKDVDIITGDAISNDKVIAYLKP